MWSGETNRAKTGGYGKEIYFGRKKISKKNLS